ncbi:helix-hairpin-helix domain-containing protein [Boseaceae bacterium BT-24-1]|nr:helix-hairpin-helix domain-containing protein [Boseaceae bacterium BT-24-1]
MSVKITCLTLALVSSMTVAAFAQSSPQTTNPANGAKTAPQQSVPSSKLNLNTATQDELRKLPSLNSGNAATIIEARKKSRFKDWNDFTGRRLVPPFTEKEIKNLVTF